jgi:hypothetical protein
MGYAILTGPCVNCRTLIHYHPHKVPSIRVNGERQPLCPACFDKWNTIHRTSKGLDPVPLDPQAYSACEESEL